VENIVSGHSQLPSVTDAPSNDNLCTCIALHADHPKFVSSDMMYTMW